MTTKKIIQEAASPTFGRPTKYLPEYNSLAENYGRLGATDAQLAVFFDVAESTINLWKLKEPTFSESLRRGKEEADQKVVEALYQRAQGYRVKEDKLSNQGEVFACEREVPADITACVFWLKNRQPESWRDKQHVELTGDFNVSFDAQDKGLVE